MFTVDCSLIGFSSDVFSHEIWLSRLVRTTPATGCFRLLIEKIIILPQPICLAHSPFMLPGSRLVRRKSLSVQSKRTSLLWGDFVERCLRVKNDFSVIDTFNRFFDLVTTVERSLYETLDISAARGANNKVYFWPHACPHRRISNLFMYFDMPTP